VDRLADLRAKSPVALVVVDTLASAVEGGDENASGDMQVLMNHCIDVAINGFCAVTLLHHVKKTTSDTEDDVSMNDVRGSGALVGAARMVVGVAKCGSAREARHGWTVDERVRSIRFAGLKSNDRPLAGEKFFRFEGVDLVARDPRGGGSISSVRAGVLEILATPGSLLKDWKAETRAAVDAALHAGVELVLDKQGVGVWATRSAVKHVLDSVGGDVKKDRAAVFEALAALIDEGVYSAQTVRNNAGNYRTVVAFP
jgi:plasmid stability protein